MKKFILLSIVLLSLLVAPLSDVFAQARLINYQGNILNQQELPYEGPVQITFELYSAEFGGSQLWSEIQNVTLNKGYFNVYLGSVSPFASNFNFNRDLWLQVTVGKGSPYQRTRLSMVPYSGFSDRSAIAGFAEDIADGSVTLAKLADEVKTAGGDLRGFYPNPTLRPGAVLENIPDGSITQVMLNPNVTTRPSGPASGDLTGFYPDPLIAAGAVKTDRLADGAVTNVKIADFTIAYNKLQNAAGLAGTILGWNGTKWVETSVPSWEKGRVKAVIGVDGNYSTDVTDAEGFITTSVGIANNGVTTAKIANDAVTYSKLQNATGAVGTILGWNGTDWVETTVPAWETDAVIGNEVLNATPNRGLIRAGAGTLASPYTLGIADDGVVNSMIINQAITLNKFANGTMNGQMFWWNAVTNTWNYSGGAAPVDNQVIRWVDNGVTRQPVWSNDDAIIGNEITDVVAAGGLQRLGAGTTASPYTVGVAPMGIVTSMIADDAVTYAKLQNAAGAAGTILSWNGGHWVENTVSALEADGIIGNELLDATAGRGLVRAGAGTTVSPYTIGIADAGVTNTMLADGAVSLSKLAAGTQIGQIMWWDQAANQWRFSTGAAPTQDQVIKWVDAGGTLTPRWAPDDMTIPFAKTITENAQTLFSLTNNGSSDLMALTSTSTGDGLSITLPNDLVGGGHALHITGGGMDQPSLIIDRTSNNGYPTGVATINATVNTLDVETSGLTVNTTINDDGNNAYDVEGIQSFLTVNNAVNNVFYSGIWGSSSTSNGISTGVWGDAFGMNAQNNFGLIGSAFNATNVNIGVLGSAKDADYATYTSQFGAGFGAGVVAINAGMTANDYGVVAMVGGNATGSYVEADDAAGSIVMNNSLNQPSIWGMNNGNGPALWAVGSNPATNGWSQDNSVAAAVNFGGGRAMYIEGGAANNENGGLPFMLDPLNNDDAALIVGNPNAASMGGGAAFATAIKTYGDIWANSTIGASQIVGLDKIIVGNMFIPGMFIEILPPVAPGAPLVIGGDVDIDGNLTVEDIVADDINADVITANTLNAALGAFTNITVTNTAAIGGNTTVGGTLGVTGATTLGSTLAVAGNTTVGGTLGVTGATTLTTLTTSGLATLNSAAIVNNATVGGTLGVTGATTLGSTLAVAGNTTVGGTFGVTGASTLNGATQINNTLGVTGATTLGNTLTVAGATQINNNLGVTGNAVIGGTLTAGNTTLANLVVNGTSNLIGAATLGNTLTVAGATQINNTLGVTGNTTLGANVAVTGNYTSAAGNITLTNGTINAENADFDNTLNVDGNTTLVGTLTVTGATALNNTLAVAGNATFNGASVTTSGATALNLGNQLFTNGSAGVANNAMLVSRGPGLSPTWTNQINQLTVNGLLTANDLLVNNDATITGNLTVNGTDVFINANVTMVGDFDLTGEMTADDLIVLNSTQLNNTVDVNGTFDVVGNSTFLGTVGITGNTTVTGTVGITGNTTVTGNTQLNGTLGVTGNTLLGANLQVNGTSDLRGTIFNTELGGGNEINIIDNTNITGNLVVTGGPGQGMISGKDLQISQNATIQQNLTVNQNTTVAQNMTVGGHTSITTLDVTGNIVNPVSAVAPVTVNDNLLVTGDATINGSLVILGDLTATNITATNNLAAGNDLNVTNNGNFGGALAVVGNYTSTNGNITLTNGTINAENGDIDGTFNVDGATTLGSTLTVAGATVVNNTFNATGAATLGSTLGVTGATTLGNTLTVAGATVVNNTFNATGATTLGSTLGVTGATTLGSTLGVTGATTIGGATTINNTLTVGAFATTLGGTLNVAGASTLQALSATTGTFSGAITGASLTTTGNVTAGGDVAGVNGIFSGNVSGVNGTFTGILTGNSIVSTTSVAAGTNITAGGNITATGNVGGVNGNFSGNVTAVGGTFSGNVSGVNGTFSGVLTGNSVNSTTTVVAGTGITSTTGNIVATAGQVNAGTSMTAGTGITSTTGNIVATAGQVNAGTSMTAGTTVTAGTGVNVTTGNVTLSNGIISQTGAGTNTFAGNINVAGTSTLQGTVVTNETVSVGKSLLVNEQVQYAPYVATAGMEDLSFAGAGVNISFLVYNSPNPITLLPAGQDGSVIIVHNNSGVALLFAGVNIPNTQTMKFVFFTASGGWLRVL